MVWARFLILRLLEALGVEPKYEKKLWASELSPR